MIFPPYQNKTEKTLKITVLLDRDGVVNFDSPSYIKSPDEWLPIKSSIKAIAKLAAANINTAICTNQSAIGRGYISENTLDSIHSKMLKIINDAGGKIDKIFYCPHAPSDNCECRKPAPGLVRQALKHFNASTNDKNKVYFVGDSIRDIDAAIASNITPVLVLTGNGMDTFNNNKDKLANISVFNDLEEFVSTII